MKNNIYYVLALVGMLCTQQVSAQNLAVGLKGGAFQFSTATLDGSLDIGPSFGIYLDYAPFEKNENLSFSIDVGAAFYDNFPSYYGIQQDLLAFRGVHKQAEEYILTLNFTEALLLEWESRSNFYVQPLVKYYFPFKVFNTKIGLVGGGMIYKSQLVNFGLWDFRYSTTEERVVDFTPGFLIRNAVQFAITVGVTFKKQLTPKLFTEVEAGLGYQTPAEDFSDEFATLRIGIVRKLDF